MQRSQSKILRAIANAPWHVENRTLRTNINTPYVSDVIQERINKHHKNLAAHPNPLLEPLLQTINTGRLKRCWPLDLQGTWHRWMNTLPRHSNIWYRSLLCIIITLAFRLYSFWFLIKKKSSHSTPSDLLCAQSDIVTNWPNKFTKQRRLSPLSKSIFRNCRLFPSACNKQYSRLLGSLMQSYWSLFYSGWHVVHLTNSSPLS